METDAPLERGKDQLTDLLDDLVYDGPLTHADAFFLCQLLEEHYSADAEDESGSHVAVEFAWDLATSLAEHVDTTEEFDWLNAYFVCSNIVTGIRRDCVEYDDTARDRVYAAAETPSHIEAFDAAADGETAQTLADAVAEMVDLLDLYFDPAEQPETAEDTPDVDWRTPKHLGMFYHMLSKRYAHGFEYEMLESVVAMDVSDLLIDRQKDDAITNRELLRGGRMVENWLEHRAKALHQTLRTTGAGVDG